MADAKRGGPGQTGPEAPEGRGPERRPWGRQEKAEPKGKTRGPKGGGAPGKGAPKEPRQPKQEEGPEEDPRRGTSASDATKIKP
ncbi:MAG: hypothetical protein CM15mP6_0990 [Methanobacteriota archaeon]|nr:MAG: hypothetical protein CM15mP6_0990 [Euryarchaeota archaeon]